MNVFFEEDGSFKAGSVLADNNTSLQIETQHGKRTKIKESAVLIRFQHASLTQFMADAQKAAAEIDPAFLWECCGELEFSFDQLGRDYFGRDPRPDELAGLLTRLHATPTHFYKKGKGRYKAAPPEALKAALAGIERKKQQAELQRRYFEQLGRGEWPKEFVPKMQELLYRPDKNSVEYKALDEAASQGRLSIPRLAEKCGGLASSQDFHLGRFLYEYFPKGMQFDSGLDVNLSGDLPSSSVEAFSIDDAQTTEIDDAFSVRRLANGNWEIGIHIAAPALGMPLDSALDAEAAKRLSTVYFPGNKITMLPESAIRGYTLSEGSHCPAVSMYLEVTADLEIKSVRNAVESIRIAANLRHDDLEDSFTEEAMAAGALAFPFGGELALLWRLANQLEKARGKSEPVQNRKDYNFHIDDNRVRIVERKRGSPLDKLVSELMILVNTEWGRLLAVNEIPALYRVQSSGKVKMSTVPAGHQGLGVAQYIWASSPLRRYCDLVNQRQLVALFRGEAPAYPQKDERLLVILRNFELTYDAYAEFQRNMERYWCLRWLEQEGVELSKAEVLRDETVRLDRLPLVARVASLPPLPPGTLVEVAVSGVDLFEVSLHCEFRSRIEPAQPE
ncbi:MAG: RNB domain-containing ribonuclease [Burkholderiales bacterium]